MSTPLAGLEMQLNSHYGPECVANTYPWLSAQCSCTVIEINCIREENDGRSLTYNRNRNASSHLVYMRIANCPNLSVSGEIRSNTGLVGIKIYNSNIFEWRANASLSGEYFTRLSYVMMIKTNMREIPEGILYNKANSLIDLEISESNLSSLPHDILVAFENFKVLYFEHSQISEFPSDLSLLSMLQELSFMYNNISYVPDIDSGFPVLNYLAFSSNPIEAIPEYYFNLPSVWEIYVDNTLISSFPNSSEYGPLLTLISAYDTVL